MKICIKKKKVDYVIKVPKGNVQNRPKFVFENSDVAPSLDQSNITLGECNCLIVRCMLSHNERNWQIDALHLSFRLPASGCWGFLIIPYNVYYVQVLWHEASNRVLPLAFSFAFVPKDWSHAQLIKSCVFWLHYSFTFVHASTLNHVPLCWLAVYLKMALVGYLWP